MKLFVQCEKDEDELWGTSSMTDSRDGKTYNTVIINGKEWMAENLAYKAGSGCWAYNDDEDNVATYGYLYNWETAKTACPPGWHLPTDEEWKQLEMAVGMSQSQADDRDWRGTNEGLKLKAKSGWSFDGYDGNGYDDFGFSALPGGFRYYIGGFDHMGLYGRWWTATELSSTNAWMRKMYLSSDQVDRDYTSKESGFSVRCVRD